MSGGNAASPAESDAQARITEHLEAREGEGSGELLYVGDTPAGGGGADSGAVDAVGVDEATEHAAKEEAESYESAHNDEPGIGTRPASD
ncbi:MULTISPECIES: hypothetical protein [unclassified Microbacterium]|uniref:hypothetical protein n=1 Tax=unclassified Microbacterium TaxID=2609290 RepID=UPI0014028362|nr:hypothetical protein [Microbacterium sp. TPD7012]